MSDDITNMNKLELRAATVPFLETEAELMAYIHNLAERPHDYGTCVYAMSMAAVAAYNYMSRKLGASGFQASVADLDILRRTRSLEHGFMLVDFTRALYPQYDLRAELERALEKERASLAKSALKKLTDVSYAHPDVIAHWQKLAAFAPKGGTL